MIKVEDLSYAFPEKELYKQISFTLEDGQHCAFIGSNGTGKTTLVHMIMEPEKYMYDGKILKEDGCRIGYVSQFAKRDKNQDVKVFDYLSEAFVHLQEENARLCAEMAEAEDLEAVFEEYQLVMDQIQAVDGDNYEVNIHRQLKVAGMTKLAELEISKLSGGEYKLLQVIKQMLWKPDLLIMDEPDVFLDFENLNGLRDLINHHKGTLLVITHNRYLLNHCFDKILHLENADIQEFDGNYTDYNFSLLQKKIELQELAAADEEGVRVEKEEEGKNRHDPLAEGHHEADRRGAHAVYAAADGVKRGAVGEEGEVVDHRRHKDAGGEVGDVNAPVAAHPAERQTGIEERIHAAPPPVWDAVSASAMRR